MVKLSERLKAVSDLVTTGSAVADVGCDHAYVPIFLLLEGRSPFASASDVRSGPLQFAKEHIEKENLEGKIRLELCSGVPKNIFRKMQETFGDPDRPFETKLTLITAGMGGLLMKQIYEEAGTDLDAFDEIVASPQRDADVFRSYLAARGFAIIDERFIEEDGKFYPIIKAQRTARDASFGSKIITGNDIEAENRPVHQECSDTTAGNEIHTDDVITECRNLFGPVLLDRKDPVLFRYLMKRKAENEKVFYSLSCRSDHENADDAAFMKAKKRESLINAAIALYEETS